MKKISQEGIDLLKKLEGSSATVYLDSAGLPTIGIGHLLTKSERMSGKINLDNEFDIIPYKDGLSEQQIQKLLLKDLAAVENAINGYVRARAILSQNQFDALCCFIFNVGVHAFLNSTLLKLLNQRKYEEIPNQLRRWIYSNNRIDQGLINRREREIKLWEGKDEKN